VPVLAAHAVERATHLGAADLERVAHTMEAELKRVPGTRDVHTIGGPERVVQVTLDPSGCANAASTCAPAQTLRAANLGMPGGRVVDTGPARMLAVQPANSCATPTRWATWSWACTRQAGLPARGGRGRGRRRAARRATSGTGGGCRGRGERGGRGRLPPAVTRQ
jgi:hypothetical protein